MTVLPSTVLRTAMLGCLLLLGGCATTGEPHPADPAERVNRSIYAFNDGLDRAVLRPTARAYHDHVPYRVRVSVSNFYSNLGYPYTIVNQLLQGKPKQAAQDTLRFAMNLTLGIGGLFDPASDANLPRHEEDLGQTLGRWGVPPGPYLMVPLLGPATLRDLPSRVASRFLEPFYWYDYGNERWVSLGLSLVDTRARLLQVDPVLDRAYDRYGFIREAYLQRRLHQVYDGDVPAHLQQDDATDESFEEEFPEEEPPQDLPQDADVPAAPVEAEEPPAPAAEPPPPQAGSASSSESSSEMRAMASIWGGTD